MKKLFWIVLIGLSIPLFAEKLNLDDSKLIERFGALMLKDKLDMYDPDEFGLYVLQKDYRSKYQKVRNDEFELDDAKKWAFDKFKKKLEKVKPIDSDAEYHLILGVKFQKYDFKAKRFPIDALTEDSYMRYGGKDDIVSSYRNSKLVFENAVDDINFISMSKDEAKKFIKARKDKYGNIDRQLIAHYIYKITEYKEVDEFKPNGRKMTLKFTGKLKSVEFMDKKRKHVLKKVDFENIGNTSSDDNNTNK